MQTNFIAPATRTVYESAIVDRMSKVTSEAEYIVYLTGCTRSEALRMAENAIPQVC